MSKEIDLIRLFRRDGNLVIKRTLADVKNHEVADVILTLESELVELKGLYFKALERGCRKNE